MKTAIQKTIVLLGVTIAGFGAEESLTARIELNPGQILGSVNRRVLGHNVAAGNVLGIFNPTNDSPKGRTGDGLWDPGRNAPVPATLALAKDIGMSVVRYPGGCLAHNFDWKKAVGPASERSNFAFGIDEWMAYCKMLGAEPIYTAPEYAGTPSEIAELVEYLNAPGDNAHPWALKRSSWGNTEPYRLRYIEIGNESYHDNHFLKPKRVYTPESYAEYFKACFEKIKKVDPAVQVGAILYNPDSVTTHRHPWNEIVLRETKDAADFYVYHTYPIRLVGDQAGSKLSADLVGRSCMASVEDFEEVLKNYKRLIREVTGREVPVAVTEFNAAIRGVKNLPDRFSLAAALFCGDFIRVLLKPENNILMANYWNFINGGWGLLDGPTEGASAAPAAAFKKMPAYHIFKLWNEHLGSQLFETRIEAPVLSFEGMRNVAPRRAGGNSMKSLPLEIKSASDSAKGYRYACDVEGKWRIELDGFSGGAYPIVIQARTKPDTLYRVRFRGRTAREIPDAVFGLTVQDGRGFEKTKSGFGIDGTELCREFHEFEGEYLSLPDATSIQLSLRLIHKGSNPASGTVEIEKISVEEIPFRNPYSALTAASTLSADGKSISLFVFNRHDRLDIRTEIALQKTSVRSAKIWTVNGPSLGSDNLQTETVRETQSGLEIPAGKSGLTATFPAHSMSVIEIKIL